jgi:hypothetical protein
MKKFLTLLWISALTMCWLTNAQSLWDIDVTFCNSDQEKQMDIVTNSNQDTDICVLFKNNSSQDTTLTINFIDWIKNDNIWKSCGIPEDPNTNFAKFIKDFDHDLFLQWNSEVEKHYTIHYPVWYEWISHGCISYEIKTDEEASQPIRSIYRITRSIDILVWWSQVKPKLVISDIYLSWYDTNQKIILEIANKWNIDQKITLTGTIKNRFWYEWKFETSGDTIPANSKITLISNEVRLPSYKWFFIVKSNLTNDPIFDFDVTKSDLKNEYSSSWLTIIKNTAMLWSRLYITLTILIIALIIALVIRVSTNKWKKTSTKKSKSKKSKSSK